MTNKEAIEVLQNPSKAKCYVLDKAISLAIIALRPTDTAGPVVDDEMLVDLKTAQACAKLITVYLNQNPDKMLYCTTDNHGENGIYYAERKIWIGDAD